MKVVISRKKFQKGLYHRRENYYQRKNTLKNNMNIAVICFLRADTSLSKTTLMRNREKPNNIDYEVFEERFG